jgi:hypothetical protein
MINEQKRPIYYDGSGTLKFPERNPEKDIIIKPNNEAAHVKFPVFPYQGQGFIY